MFKKSRQRIVAAIMSVLALLFLGTLAVIYIASYLDVSRSNYRMLERHAQMYSLYEHVKEEDLGSVPPEWPGPEPEKWNKLPPEWTPEFEVSTFYSVALTRSGTFLVADTADNGVYEAEQLEELAWEIVQKNREKGVNGELIYLVTEKNGYVLVTFMDNRIMKESMNTLFHYTLIFGSIAMTVLFFLAVYLAGRIVRPLEESYQKQKQFISDAGHELKTPIAVVSANAELLQREIGETAWLSNIQYENDRMRLLVGQLLELARTEQVEPKRERLNISHLLTGEVLPFESIAYEKRLSMHTDIQPDLYAIGDSMQLKQLASVLIDNAIRHSKAGGEVQIRLWEKKNTLKCSVINSGDTISPEQQKHLFDRFYRLDEARNGEEQHYGLGLAIASAIVTSHHGKIEVRSQDGLIEFCFTLPRS